MLLGTAALAALGVTAAACGKPPPPPDLDDLMTQLDMANGDSQRASDAAAAAPPPLRPPLAAVSSERSKHAEALSNEIARLTGEAATSTSSTTTSATQASAPTTNDVIAALRRSADSAGQLAAQLSGYRAGLLGSIAASCTAAYSVALAPREGTP
jgi:sirohydrochlorin ferrochelatase